MYLYLIKRVSAIVVWLFLTSVPTVAIANQTIQTPNWFTILEPYISRVQQENPHSKALQTRGLAVQQLAKASKSLPDPMIGIGLQGVPTNLSLTAVPMTLAPTISMRQAIPLGNKRKAKAALLAAKGKRFGESSRALSQKEALGLAISSFSVHRYRTEIQAVEETLGWYEILYKAVEARYRTGQGQQLDVDQIRVEMGRLTAEKSQLIASSQSEQATWYKILLTEYPEALNLPEQIPWQVSKQSLLQELANNPSLLVQQARIKEAEQNVAVEQTGYMPDLVVDLGYGWRGAQQSDLMSGKLMVSVPLWASWSQKNKVEGAKQTVNAEDTQAIAILARAKSELFALFAQHEDTQTREKLYTTSILSDARKAKESAQAAYEAGLVDIFVPIASISRELHTTRELARIIAQRRTIEAKLMALIGQLTKQG